MTQRGYTDQQILLNAVAANGVSAAFNAASFRNIELQLAQVGFSGTIKLVGSNADAAPDFSAAATASNPWDYVQSIDQIDGSSIAGGTGITSVTVTSIRNLEANTNAFKWFGLVISNYSAGSVTAKVKGVTEI
jgi:hypothetical protein